MKKIFKMIGQTIRNPNTQNIKLFTSSRIACEKYDCLNCSNCDKLLDCKKYIYGILIGSSFGFFFGYNYSRKSNYY